jgi:hypothetical protein
MIRIYTSSVIDASPDAVWSVIRDFNALPAWHPLIADSRIEDGMAPDRVGCVRRFHLVDGGELREQLLTLSDNDYQCTYSILSSPMPLTNYIATVKLTRVTDGNRTFAEWRAQFDCELSKEHELSESIGQGVFQVGFDALKKRFARP